MSKFNVKLTREGVMDLSLSQVYHVLLKGTTAEKMLSKLKGWGPGYSSSHETFNEMQISTGENKFQHDTVGLGTLKYIFYFFIVTS